VYSGDFDLLGFKIEEKFYIDKCMPMGCSASCGPPIVFGIKPIGEHLKFDIGRVSNGPTILPAIISLSIFNQAPSGFESTDFKFFESKGCLGPLLE
jgi:hypothetical protein